MADYSFSGMDVCENTVNKIRGTLSISPNGHRHAVKGLVSKGSYSEILKGFFYARGWEAMIDVAAIQFHPEMSYNLFRLSSKRLTHLIRQQGRIAESLDGLVFTGERYHCMEGVKPQELKDSWDRTIDRYIRRAYVEIKLDMKP
jgi:hypothetical protein